MFGRRGEGLKRGCDGLEELGSLDAGGDVECGMTSLSGTGRVFLGLDLSTFVPSTTTIGTGTARQPYYFGTRERQNM